MTATTGGAALATARTLLAELARAHDERCAAMLARGPLWPDATGRALLLELSSAVTACWERGWQPADLAAYAARGRTARHRRVVLDAVAAELRAYPAAADPVWRAQPADLGATPWWTAPDHRPSHESAHERASGPSRPADVVPDGQKAGPARAPGSGSERGPANNGPDGPERGPTRRSSPGSACRPGHRPSDPGRGPDAEPTRRPAGCEPGGPESGTNFGPTGGEPGGPKSGRQSEPSFGARGASEGDGWYAEAWCARNRAEPEELVGVGVEVLRVLRRAPRMARIGPLPGTVPSPGEPSPGADPRVLGRVRALLAKAESTEFPSEAEALSARAQELMARHSIDRALLARTGGGDVPRGRRIVVESPYESAKAVLLTVVAEANRCRAVWHRELGLATVVGHPADLAAADLLFTSLLVQATSAMTHAGPRRDARGTARTRSFRHSFLNAYAARVGERLRAAAGQAADRAGRRAGGTDLVPLLAARDAAVGRAVDALFPDLVRGRAGTVSNPEGWAAGRAAADLAGLDGRPAVADPSRGP
ncbi:DUF2786 domain-containing protein [Actinomadura atramentaria]|uniref:DUF2786 domain-containing protein n=1 Tax=Actinomadura atramentaria TaxID=1990 RepID=UPI000365D4FA|nr:DUF2786 domain-containing protein [Actinomadura atramentaria]